MRTDKNRPEATPDRDGRVEQELSALRREFEGLKEEKVRAEQDVANLSRQIAELSALALAEYGTSDPQALERLLEEKRRENERLAAEYRAHIEEIQKELSAIERPKPAGEAS